MRTYRNVDVFDMGNPYQSVDITMWQQYEKLLPYLKKEVFPLLMFDDADIQSYLQSMETISIMSCKTNFNTIGIRWLDLARECLRFNNVNGALRIISLNEKLCDYQIHSYKTEPMNLDIEERKVCIGKWETTRSMAAELADMIQNRPKEIKLLIEKNKISSEKACQEFFSSRYFSIKSSQQL